MSPRFVTTKLPVPRHRDGRSVFNPFSERSLLAVLAKQWHYFRALYSDINRFLYSDIYIFYKLQYKWHVPIHEKCSPLFLEAVQRLGNV